MKRLKSKSVIVGWFLTTILATILFFSSNALANEQDLAVEGVKMNNKALKDLTLQFSQSFSKKDATSIGLLLDDNVAIYDPALKWVRGKEAVIKCLQKTFGETKKVAYEVVNMYQDGDMTILEFKITLDELNLYGVDFIQWKNNKMVELRCYYNPPDSKDNSLKSSA